MSKTARNDHTGDAIRSKPTTDAYRNSPYWRNKDLADRDRLNECCGQCSEPCGIQENQTDEGGLRHERDDVLEALPFSVAARQIKALRQLESELAIAKRPGCLDHGCVISPPPKGQMGTNGGCRCQYFKLIREIQKARAQLAEARETVRFFASVIKSGKPWTETYEQYLRTTLYPQGKDNVERPVDDDS